jgi:hypothetical protein
VELTEGRVFTQIGSRGEHKDHWWWVLDMGATNHMTGAIRTAFSELDFGIHSSVKFGDGSVIEIEGCGTIIFFGKGGEHRWLTGVYYIPRLKSNIISLGQLDEGGCHIYIKQGVLKICDQSWRVLTRETRAANRLYILELNIEQPVCLSAKAEKSLWKWHARFGHPNFPALQKSVPDQQATAQPIPHQGKLSCIREPGREDCFFSWSKT